jgi:hypothetical protein
LSADWVAFVAMLFTGSTDQCTQFCNWNVFVEGLPNGRCMFNQHQDWTRKGDEINDEIHS